MVRSRVVKPALGLSYLFVQVCRGLINRCDNRSCCRIGLLPHVYRVRRKSHSTLLWSAVASHHFQDTKLHHSNRPTKKTQPSQRATPNLQDTLHSSQTLLNAGFLCASTTRA